MQENFKILNFNFLKVKFYILWYEKITDESKLE